LEQEIVALTEVARASANAASDLVSNVNGGIGWEESDKEYKDGGQFDDESLRIIEIQGLKKEVQGPSAELFAAHEQVQLLLEERNRFASELDKLRSLQQGHLHTSSSRIEDELRHILEQKKHETSALHVKIEELEQEILQLLEESEGASNAEGAAQVRSLRLELEVKTQEVDKLRKNHEEREREAKVIIEGHIEHIRELEKLLEDGKRSAKGVEKVDQNKSKAVKSSRVYSLLYTAFLLTLILILILLCAVLYFAKSENNRTCHRYRLTS